MERWGAMGGGGDAPMVERMGVNNQESEYVKEINKIFQSGWIYIVIMSAINSASTTLDLGYLLSA